MRKLYEEIRDLSFRSNNRRLELNYSVIFILVQFVDKNQLGRKKIPFWVRKIPFWVRWPTLSWIWWTCLFLSLNTSTTSTGSWFSHFILSLIYSLFNIICSLWFESSIVMLFRFLFLLCLSKSPLSTEYILGQ